MASQAWISLMLPTSGIFVIWINDHAKEFRWNWHFKIPPKPVCAHPGFSSKEGLWMWSSELFQKGPNCTWPGLVWCPVLAMIIRAQLLKVSHKHNHISVWREAQLVSTIQVTKPNAIPMLSLLIFLSQSTDNNKFYGQHSWELSWARVSSSSAKHAASWQSIPDKILHFWKFKAPNRAKVRGFHAAWCLQSWYM